MPQTKSAVSHAILDSDTRRRKARKIIAVLEQYIDLSNCRLLDIGTGSGDIANELAKSAKQVASVDRVDERSTRSGYEFKQVADERLPFDDNSFDVVVSNHVIEHVPNQTLHVEEIYRVLKPGGTVYLATPNRWWWRENHYRLPFLGWLPRPLASRYVQLVRHREWDVYPLSFGQIKRLNSGRMELISQTAHLFKRPKQLHLSVPAPVSQVAQHLPDAWLNSLTGFLPTFIIILKKSK